MMRILFLVLSLIFSTAPLAAQSPLQETSKPFSVLVKEWNRVLDYTARYVASPSKSDVATADRRKALARVRKEAAAAKKLAEARAREQQQLLEALGPPPAETEPAESPEIAKKRVRFSQDIADYRGRISEADLAIARAERLDAVLVGLGRAQFFDFLTSTTPIPLAPGVIVKAAGQLPSMLVSLGARTGPWVRALASGGIERQAVWRAAAVIAILVLAAIALRHFLLLRFGRTALETAPSHPRRLGAAIAEATANSLVPGTLAACGYVIAKRGLLDVSGVTSDILLSISYAVLIVSVAATLARAILTPAMPAWRLVELDSKTAHRMRRRINWLAAAIAVDTAIAGSITRLAVSGDLYSVGVLVASLAEAGTVLLLLHEPLWAGAPAGDDGADVGTSGEEAKPRRAVLAVRLRQLGRLIAVAGLAAGLLGYGHLARFLVLNLVITLATVGVLVLVRNLVRDLVGTVTRSEFFRRRVGLRYRSRAAVKFWSRTLLDIVLVVAGLLFVLPLWGVPREDFYGWVLNAAGGIEIGGVTISVIDIALAVAAFVAALGVTKLLQRTLSEKILPQTSLDTGLRNSIAAGAGYFGTILAGLIAIAVLGINLTNIALIAGALSVGIGFGLQNVVNNFVSGIILLIERPVKVGDWVVIGDKEGTIKQIHVRATELQTFQRASVIIPNADFISTPVINWTHKDTYGRIEVKVGVAYGSPVERVSEILLACARNHPRVENYPEPFVLFQDFGASSLDFELRCYTGNVMWRLTIASDIRFDIDRRFREEGIEIPFPQRVVHFAGETDAGPSQTSSQPTHHRKGQPGDPD